MDETPDWYEDFFEGEWLDHVSLQPRERTEREIAFILDKLGLEAGSRILDLACGRGRIAVELARRGFRVTGLDLSARSLDLAARAAAEAGVDLTLVRRDMRELADEEAFEAILNVWTSFGYFDREEDDERVLANVARALVPGGLFLIDTINPMVLAARFVPEQRRELEDGNVVIEYRSYDHLNGRFEGVWTFVHPDGSQVELRSSHRSYTAAELARLLRNAGLAVEGAWGSFDGAPLGADVRTILLARRPRD
jgi:SAM-dependent methyltransferase